MLIEQFNNKLRNISHRLTLLRLTRNQLINEEQNIIRLMMENDVQQKGGFTPKQIMNMWIKESKYDDNKKLQFIELLFPFQLASYSIIYKFIKGHLNSDKKQFQNSKQIDLNHKIEQIFSLELQNNLELVNIFEDMSKFIPTYYMKPTKNQFYQYVASQQLSIDVQEMSKALSLPDLPPPKKSINNSQDFKHNLWEPSIDDLQGTMNRLKNRVRQMGSQCFE